jgi:hypothetical protein
MAAISVATRSASVALDFFIGILLVRCNSDCPASGSRSRQLLFLFGSNNNQTGDDSESSFLSSLPL